LACWARRLLRRRAYGSSGSRGGCRRAGWRAGAARPGGWCRGLALARGAAPLGSAALGVGPGERPLAAGAPRGLVLARLPGGGLGERARAGVPGLHKLVDPPGVFPLGLLDLVPESADVARADDAEVVAADGDPCRARPGMLSDPLVARLSCR